MTNTNTPNPFPDLYMPPTMSSSSSSPPPLLPPTPTPYSHPQKPRKKRSKLIKIDPAGFLLPSPNPNPSANANATPSASYSHHHHHHHHQHHSLALSRQFGRRERFGAAPEKKFRHCCPECFKQFGSEKALYGHMRCHPDRDYRGMTRKPVRYHRVSNTVSTSSSSLIHEESTAVMMSVEDHEVASCLLMLSRTGILETETEMETDFGGVGVGGNDCGASCSFECSSCKKVFGSHQALGGHRASHKNVKGCFAINRSCDEIDDEEDQNCINDAEMKEMGMILGHQCSICLRVFPSGQALGGHKRCHWEKGDDQGHNGNFVGKGLDLNLPAPTSVDDDQDQSCSSYHNSSDLTLDLRLGL